MATPALLPSRTAISLQRGTGFDIKLTVQNALGQNINISSGWSLAGNWCLPVTAPNPNWANKTGAPLPHSSLDMSNIGVLEVVCDTATLNGAFDNFPCANVTAYLFLSNDGGVTQSLACIVDITLLDAGS